VPNEASEPATLQIPWKVIILTAMISTVGGILATEGWRQMQAFFAKRREQKALPPETPEEGTKAAEPIDIGPMPGRKQEELEEKLKSYQDRMDDFEKRLEMYQAAQRRKANSSDALGDNVTPIRRKKVS
jgi:hypothetical protein